VIYGGRLADISGLRGRRADFEVRSIDDLLIRKRGDLDAAPTDHFRCVPDSRHLYESSGGPLAIGFGRNTLHNRTAAQGGADPGN